MSLRFLGAPSLLRLLGSWRSAGRGPAHRQLADALRLLILDGRLPLALRLPGERELAASLGLSRTTVSGAYGLLKESGFLVGRQGSGSVTSLPDRPGHSAEAPEPRAETIEFSIAALPASESVHRAYAAALAALPRHLPTGGYDSTGLPELRAVVAGHYARLGAATSPEQILVTQGAQQGLALLLRLLTRPGDAVVIEHPTYSLALEALQGASCRPVPVALTGAGWDAEAFSAAFRQETPRLAYLQPDFHNPTGLLMEEDCRTAMAQAAERHGVPLIVDETMADLWLEGGRPRPMAAFADARHVISVGSTGKSYWGGLRIGWIRADAQTIAALARVRAAFDLGSPVLEQLAAAVLLSEEDEALAARREALRRRRDHLLHLVADRLPEWRANRPAGGLSLWAELPRPVSSALAVAADAEGLRIGAGPRFGVSGAFERFLRLPYALPEDGLTDAVERLSRAWDSLDRRPLRAHPAEARMPGLV